MLLFLFFMSRVCVCDRNGFPSARFVLMKAMEDDGLTFFTNYGSRKAQEIVSVIGDISIIIVIDSFFCSDVDIMQFFII